METQTVTEFLLARYDEDEADAEQMLLDLDRWDRERELSGADGTQGSIIAATLRGGAFDPARVLAECEAKRRIVNLEIDADGEILHGVVLWRLVQPYADHPDFQPEWRP